MKLREQILSEHSKEQCAAIVQWVGRSPKRFDELFELFLSDEYRVVQRAAWPVSYCVEAHPELFAPHYQRLIQKLEQPGNHDAVKRNSVRLLQHVEIPEAFQGAIMNICFEYLESPTEAAAIKAFSITVLGNLARHYPEILPELRLIIEDQWQTQGSAVRGRAEKLFKNIGRS